MLYILSTGAFDHSQLAPLRLVNRALRDAASDPQLYRACSCDSVAAVKALPPFVANSLNRIGIYCFEELDLGDVSKRMPNLTSLTAPGFNTADLVEGAIVSLRELMLKVEYDQCADFLSQLTNLECLAATELGHVAPIVSLPRLIRLSLGGYNGDTKVLMAALVSSPCASTLEAFYVRPSSSNAMVSPGWWAPVSGFHNLREFRLACETGVGSPRYVVRTLADVLANHPTLAVLDLEDPPEATVSLIGRGLPSNLKVLGLFSRSNDDFEAFVASLPRDLSALRFESEITRSAADVRALLSRCPHLSALDLDFDYGAIEYLASGNVYRSLTLNRRNLPDWVDHDALTAAGHTVGSLLIAVNWCIAGGVLFDGEGVAV